MLRTLVLILVFCFSVVLRATEAPSAKEAASPAKVAEALGPPSCEAAGMPGAIGTFDFKPRDWQEGKTTFWIDSDGVNPGKPGCHLGSTDQRQRNGRMFGEACQDGTGFLIETNPSANKLHLHENDLGHPDLFDCGAWCRGTGFPGGGSCVPVDAPPDCPSSIRSAQCVCR